MAAARRRLERLPGCELHNLHGPTQAAAAVVREDTRGDPRLVAYVVPSDGPEGTGGTGRGPVDGSSSPARRGGRCGAAGHQSSGAAGGAGRGAGFHRRGRDRHRPGARYGAHVHRQRPGHPRRHRRALRSRTLSRLDLEVPDDLEIEYVNLVRIAHSPSELIFDFAHLLPGASPAKVQSRIIMSPLGAKLFYRALAENLAKYEAAFGEIRIPGSSSLADYLFRPPQSPESPPEK